jgi:hypothetical protein
MRGGKVDGVVAQGRFPSRTELDQSRLTSNRWEIAAGDRIRCSSSTTYLQEPSSVF